MKEIVLQYQEEIIKVALFENGQLIEVHEEEANRHRAVGNIYRGKVMNVLPGMQAAFVDIGLEKNAFLFVGDAIPLQYDQEDKLPPDPKIRIEEILKPGQDLLVQVTKEAVGTKGPRITTNITIPGRYGVLLPTGEYVGVSRKITNEQERDRLRELAQEVCPSGMGIIVRTLGEGVHLPELEQDVKELVELWGVLEKEIPKVSVPGLVHQDVNLVSRMLRDWVDHDVKSIT
ncbi:MAG: ribonuclease E/G, partial [Desulfitobacterium sp.]|nr:ribonuclease E/G [Desulfitobacterium sp.]